MLVDGSMSLLNRDNNDVMMAVMMMMMVVVVVLGKGHPHIHK